MSQPGTQERLGHRHPDPLLDLLLQQHTAYAGGCKLQVANHSKSRQKHWRKKKFYSLAPFTRQAYGDHTSDHAPLRWASVDTPLPGATRPHQPHVWSWEQAGSCSSLLLSPGDPINHRLEQKLWREFTLKSLSPDTTILPSPYPYLCLGREWDGISNILRANFMAGGVSVPNPQHPGAFNSHINWIAVRYQYFCGGWVNQDYKRLYKLPRVTWLRTRSFKCKA